MDAANLTFADGSFDIAVAMFVMTVVPDPHRVLAEMVRVVRPGGRIVVVNHFSAEAGVRARVEKWLSRFSSSLGWNPEFAMETLLGRAELKPVAERSLQPLGLYTLLVFERV
jgi:phosphatidylethanolamine/phosphatidyl-N-methylethanolamine N-methyltransferase